MQSVVAFFSKQVVGPFQWLFTSHRSALIWLALRLYLASVWLSFGIDKLRAGWLAGDPVGQMFRAVVKGQLRIPLAIFGDFAAFMLDHQLTVVLSHTIPFAEIAVGVSLISGVLLVPASIGGMFLIVNVILSGISSLIFDGRMLVLHLLLLLAFQVAGRIGVESYAIQHLRPMLLTHAPLPTRRR